MANHDLLLREWTKKGTPDTPFYTSPPFDRNDPLPPFYIPFNFAEHNHVQNDAQNDIQGKQKLKVCACVCGGGRTMCIEQERGGIVDEAGPAGAPSLQSHNDKPWSNCIYVLLRLLNIVLSLSSASFSQCQNTRSSSLSSLTLSVIHRKTSGVCYHSVSMFNGEKVPRSITWMASCTASLWEDIFSVKLSNPTWEVSSWKRKWWESES